MSHQAHHLLLLPRYLHHQALHGPGEILPAGAEVEAEGLPGGLQPGDEVAGEVGELPGGEDIRHHGVRLGLWGHLVNTSLHQHNWSGRTANELKRQAMS